MIAQTAPRSEYVESALMEAIAERRALQRELRARDSYTRMKGWRAERANENALRELVRIAAKGRHMFRSDQRRIAAALAYSRAWAEYDAVRANLDMDALRAAGEAMDRLEDRADGITLAKAEQDRWNAA